MTARDRAIHRAREIKAARLAGIMALSGYTPATWAAADGTPWVFAAELLRRLHPEHEKPPSAKTRRRALEIYTFRQETSCPSSVQE